VTEALLLSLRRQSLRILLTPESGPGVVAFAAAPGLAFTTSSEVTESNENLLDGV
jgi:hypothetical protein